MAAFQKDHMLTDLSSQASGRTWYSFEYFPPRTEDGVKNLYDRLDRMALLNPLFMDFTWGAVSAPPMRAARWC